MTGSHEVRGSIPLGSTNNCYNLAPQLTASKLFLCAYSVPTLKLPNTGSSIAAKLFRTCNVYRKLLVQYSKSISAFV
jgi:hypothetical protein